MPELVEILTSIIAWLAPTSDAFIFSDGWKNGWFIYLTLLLVNPKLEEVGGTSSIDLDDDAVWMC